jgi:putative DNA primase/helicase
MIPPELRKRDQWVVWRYEDRGGKQTKVPYRPAEPSRRAAADDPSTWASFEQAARAAENDGVAGIGYVFAADDPFCGIDLDGCRDPETERLESWAGAIVTALNSYTEASPSRAGVHVLIRAGLDGGRNRKGPVEMYDRERFFCVTGEHVRGTPTEILPRQAELDEVRGQVFPPPADNGLPAPSTPVDLDDTELLQRAMTARNGASFERLWNGEQNGHPSGSEADLALCGMLAFWTGGDPSRIDTLFRRSGLMREKWERADYRERTIATAVAGRTEFYSPRFTVPENLRKAGPALALALEPVKAVTAHERTDLGNAELFVELNQQRFRHVRERKAWLVWSGGRWRPDTTGEPERAAKATARALLRRAAELEGDEQKAAVRHAMQTQSEPRIRAMLILAATEPEVALPAGAFDADPFLLACANGTLDLRTGELRAHDPSDLLSLGTDVPYDAEATCPRWLRFQDEVAGGDPELVAFKKRAWGYTLTGAVSEQVLFVAHGAGCNGKTVEVETMQRVLGDFALTSPFESFVRVRGDRGPRNDVARLHRARLVVAAESGEGRRLDEALVKMLTGGDTVAARFLYGEHFEFRPRFKLFLVTNHRPRVDGDDSAIWRRLRLVPYEISFEGREEKGLAWPGSSLEAELPGILAWAVEGSLEWQREGLGLPPAVKQATSDYRADEDLLGAFLEERCKLAGSIEASGFRDSYEAFCKEIGERPLTAGVLGKSLVRRGISVEKTRGGRTYHGVELLP